MLNKACSALLFLVVCFAQTKDDLGVQIRGIGYESSTFFQAGGQKHVLFAYASLTGAVNTQFFHVNMSTGTAYVVDTGRGGRGNMQGRQVSTGNNHLYFVTSDPCYVYDYDLIGGVTNIAHASWGAGACGTTGAIPAANKAPTYCSEGAAGKIFCGTAVYGTAFEIDTSTNAITDFGQISTTSGVQYANVQWADANYFWVVNRDTTENAYWLTSVKISDGTQTDCFKDTPGTENYIYIRKSDNQPFYNYGTPGANILTADGTCPASSEDMPAAGDRIAPFNRRGNVWFDTATAKADLSLDADLSQVYASPSGVVAFSYRNPGGSGAWATKTGTLTTSDQNLKRVVQKASTDTLFVVGGQYTANADMSIASSAATNLGTIGVQSAYAAVWDGTYWYLSGYASTTYRYNPAVAWTLSADTTLPLCTEASPVNPCLAKTGWGKYHYYNGMGSDGRLYVGAHYERQGGAGGEIGWYNPADNTTGSYRAGPPSIECWSPSDFVPMTSAGTTFAYSGSADSGEFDCTETVGKIYIFDVATQMITNTLTPIVGSSDPGKLLPLASGHILGFVKNYPTAADYTIYSIDPATDTLDWSITGVGNLFNDIATADCRPVLGADGYAYFYIGNNLTRLHPLTGATETAYADSTAHGGMSLVSGPFGNAMYLWGSTHLYRINLWRPAALRVKNAQSTATQIRLLYGRTTTLDATSQTVACAYNADCYVPIPGHVIGDMYYRWQFLTAGGAVTAASDITKVTIN